MCKSVEKVMCTRLQIGIKAVSSLASRFGAVPCGVCAECRAVKKSSWTFRLRVEFEELVKNGWQIGFCTLTYKDSRLPHIPLWFVKDKSVKSTPMCFSHDHVDEFIKGLRNWCYRKYKMRNDSETGLDDRFRFMICSEFGEHTQRSHYHAIFAFPPQCDARKFYEQIKTQWCENGHVFPRYFEGGVDSHGYNHKPFLVDTVSAAAAYCAKYCTKDLAYYGSIDLDNYSRIVTDWEGNKDRLARYLPFHSQSRSLGLAWLKSLDDRQKLYAIINGVSFVGDDRLKRLPVYLTNKILFNTYYCKDSEGKRLCRKQSNQFFDRYYNEIFEQKANLIEDKIKHWSDIRAVSVPPSLAGHFGYFCRLLGRFKPFAHRVARDYLAFGGVWSANCVNVDRAHFWHSRYCCWTDGVNVEDVVYYSIDSAGLRSAAPSVPYSYLESLNWFFSYGNKLENHLNKVANLLKLEEERQVQKIREYYKHFA